MRNYKCIIGLESEQETKVISEKCILQKKCVEQYVK